MFTVIILSEDAKRIFGSSCRLFEPFVDEGLIAFCEWNESTSALEVEHVLPSLHEVIEGKREWRAVVVDSMSDSDTMVRDLENPFDYLGATTEGSAVGQLRLVDSPYPLVRLSHVLLGYPDLGVKRFAPVLSSTDPSTGDRDDRPVGPDEIADAYRQALGSRNDVQVHFMEEGYSADERERHASLQRQYEMKQVRPMTVTFVSTRRPVDENPSAVLRKAWRVGDEQRPSRFVERNEYPPSCRFAVFDLINSERAGYDLEVLRLWLSVLTVAINELPPSSLQADRLYRLSVGINEISLVETLNQHLGRLADSRDHLEALIQQPDRLVDAAVLDILKPKTVQVEFDRLGTDELTVDVPRFGLVADRPRGDSSRWQAAFDAVKRSAELFVPRRRRVLVRAVHDARFRAQSFLADDYALHEMEREELADELTRRLPALTVPVTAEILDHTVLDRALSEHNRMIVSMIRERMSLGATAVASGVVLFVWLASFVPYLIQATSKASSDLVMSAVLVGGVLLVLAVAALLALLYARFMLRQRIRQFDQALRGFAGRISSGAGAIAGFLSQLATYMYGKSVLLGAARRDDEMRLARTRRRRMHTQIVEVMRTEKAIVQSLGHQLAIPRGNEAVSGIQLEDERVARHLFWFPRGDQYADLDTTGEQVRSPYDFVTQLHVDRQVIYERVLESAKAPSAAAAGEESSQ